MIKQVSLFSSFSCFLLFQYLPLLVGSWCGVLFYPSSTTHPVCFLLAGPVYLCLFPHGPVQGCMHAAQKGHHHSSHCWQGLRRHHWFPDRGPPQGRWGEKKCLHTMTKHPFAPQKYTNADWGGHIQHLQRYYLLKKSHQLLRDHY